MSWYDGFLKQKPERDPKDEPVSPIIYVSGVPVRLISYQQSIIADRALKNPAVYRVVDKIASSVRSVKWFAEPDLDLIASERANAGEIKRLNAMLKSPNDNFTSEQIRYWLALNYAMYDRVAFKVGVSSEGYPNGIYPLVTKHVNVVLNNRGIIDKYEYGQGDQKQTFLTKRNAEKLPNKSSYAYEIFAPNLNGSFEAAQQSTAIESVALPIHIINCLLQRAVDSAEGHPNIRYIITAEKTLTKQQKEALTQHLSEAGPGDENSGHVLFLYNTSIEVHPLDTQLGDIHTKIPSDDMVRNIAGVFGVPIALLGLGAADGAKYAGNYEESRISFWQDTIIPGYLSPLASGMTAALCSHGARISFDLDTISTLWTARVALGEKLTKTNFLTNNEKRELLGFPPIDGGNVVAPVVPEPTTDETTPPPKSNGADDKPEALN